MGEMGAKAKVGFPPSEQIQLSKCGETTVDKSDQAL